MAKMKNRETGCFAVIYFITTAVRVFDR